MIKLIINKGYSESVPPLTTEEYHTLKESIESEGQHLPIIVNKDLVVLDGHHRYNICQELSLIPKYEIKEFDNNLEEKKFVYKINLERRHLNDFQKAEIGYRLQQIESQKAKSRQLAYQLREKSSRSCIGPKGIRDDIDLKEILLVFYMG